MELIKEGQKITEKYVKVRQLTERLCKPLQPEDFVVQPIADVSPPKWHLAHTSWFFETFVLIPHYRDYKAFDPHYNYLFNSYYESVGDRLARPDRGNLIRPLKDEIFAYRAYVDFHMGELLEKAGTEQIFQLTVLGLNHEQQHQELLVTDIKYSYGHNALYPVYFESPGEHEVLSTDAYFIDIPEAVYSVGCAGGGFCYDNEQPSYKSYLHGFALMNRLVNNGEYLEFIKSGGYKDFRHWHMEGWETVKSQQWEAPLYWISKDKEWYEYTLNGLRKLELSAPVTHISFYEAAAYAQWAGKRLLTESEWEAAAQYLTISGKIGGNFLESGKFHPSGSDHNFQLLGDTWEWTNSAYLPYPGYKREEGAMGEYNGKFMINQMVLKGGSCATPESHIRTSYRNFFHPDKRWQFTGIRLAENR